MANIKPPLGPSAEPFDESTKVHSADDLDEILRHAAGAGGADDFDLDEHTKIGPSQELAAQSMAVPDPMPAMPTPVPRPANVIRRTSPSIPAVRASTPMPAVEALASGSNVEARATSPAAVNEEDPFAGWDELDAPSRVPEVAAVAELAAPPPPAPPVAAPRIATPTVPPIPMPMPMPVLAEPAPSVKPVLRIGVLVWGLTIAIMFAGGAYAFRTITRLADRAAEAERAAATATHDADEARAAAAAATRQIDATKTQLYELRAALDAANAELAKRPAKRR